MLKVIRIKRFKAIEDSEDVVLGPFNVFIGRNGSGKSSVVEFLELVANTMEFDLHAAAMPFRRGRDVVRGWDGGRDVEASLSLQFDPGDVSAGDVVSYEIGISAPNDGGALEISTERLSVEAGEVKTDVIRTDDGARLYRVPPTRIAGKIKGQRKVSSAQTVGERIGSDWIRIDDAWSPALKHVDRLFSEGGYALRNWFERVVTLRLFPPAVAEFAPKLRRRGRKDLDPAGYQTAELLATLSEDERLAVVDKLRFVTSGFSELVSHDPKGPGDQRYFYVREQSDGKSIEIPAWVLSEGTRRLTSILAITLKDIPPPLVSIEEVENGFDPWTLRFVLEELVACSERGTQILLTTHSPYLMNLLPREVFHFVTRGRGGTEFSKISSDAGTARVLSTLGIGDAYVGDLLGSSK
jgi:predicted ATPase